MCAIKKQLFKPQHIFKYVLTCTMLLGSICTVVKFGQFGQFGQLAKMLFLAYNNNNTLPHRITHGVTCVRARQMVASWVDVEAHQVFLWWKPTEELDDCCLQTDRFLRDDDERLYQHGAIYFSIANQADSHGFAVMPELAWFVRMGVSMPSIGAWQQLLMPEPPVLVLELPEPMPSSDDDSDMEQVD